LENLKAHNNSSVNELSSSMHHGVHHSNHSSNGLNQYFHNNQIQSNFGINNNNTQNVHKFVQSINAQFSKIFVNSGIKVKISNLSLSSSF